MIPAPFRPKFLTTAKIIDLAKSMAECEKCHAQWKLPEGKTQIMSRCTSCQNELIFDLKVKMGTLPKITRISSPEAVQTQ